jgi:hypothetical protein
MDVGLAAGLRGKLERLMLFRVVMVTLLLGSALVVNVDDANGFSDPALVVIFGLIIFTYVATIIYATLGHPVHLRLLDVPDDHQRRHPDGAQRGLGDGLGVQRAVPWAVLGAGGVGARA